MPRLARVKEKNLPHHIICRSIMEVPLYATNADKEKYLLLMQQAAIEFQVEILAYCLMDTHNHILIHPRGADLSKFMHKINNTYAKYYNKIHERRGHLFDERFKSKVVYDFNYLLRASTYIHNNAKDIVGYKSIEDYPYSSIIDYINPGQGRNIASASYVLGALNKDRVLAIKQYRGLLDIQSKGEEAFVKQMLKDFEVNAGYQTIKSTFERNANRGKVIKAVAKILNINQEKMVHVKYSHKYSELRGLTVVALRIFCDLTVREIGYIIKGISASGISYLSKIGIKTLEDKPYLLEALFQEI